MKRECGVLLAISSLPSSYGIGDFGKEAYRFVDFLEASGPVSYTHLQEQLQHKSVSERKWKYMIVKKYILVT